MKQRARRNRHLMAALATLVNLAGRNKPSRIMAAFGANETIRPPEFGNRGGTGLFSTEALLPFQQTHLGHFHNEILL
jgi:hypothetical protein